MATSYCLELSFKDVNFDSFVKNEIKSQSKFHAHLVHNEALIELHIFYGADYMFPHKFDSWLKSIRWIKFGKYLNPKLIQSKKENYPIRIDLSESEFETWSGGYHDPTLGSFIKVEISQSKMYWKANIDEKGKASFYLNRQGFNLVSEFYSLLFESNEKTPSVLLECEICNTIFQ